MTREEVIRTLDKVLTDIEDGVRKALPRLLDDGKYMEGLSDEDGAREMELIGTAVATKHPGFRGLVEAMVGGFQAGRKGENKLLVVTELRKEDFDSMAGQRT